MNKVNYEFREWHDDDCVIELNFTENEDEMNCARFHDFCKKFAIAIGYMPNTVEKFFGETRYEEMFNI